MTVCLDTLLNMPPRKSEFNRRPWRVSSSHSAAAFREISASEENQQRQENGDEMMQTCVENYQRRDGESSGGISSIVPDNTRIVAELEKNVTRRGLTPSPRLLC